MKHNSNSHSPGSEFSREFSSMFKVFSTGKSLSEASIFASTNPQYDDRLFIELQVQENSKPKPVQLKTIQI